MALTEKVKSYHSVDMSFLDSSCDLSFNIYYKTIFQNESRYVLFANKDPVYRDKVRLLLDAEDFTELYIDEEDLLGYFQHATESLQSFILDKEVPIEKKIARVYDLSKNVTKQFFESNTSPDILRCSDQVVELMESCISQKEFGFHALTKILEKDYYTYTHSINVGLYCMTFGVKSQLPAGDIHELGLGGMLHDIGKSAIPKEIVNKQGKLTEEEFTLIQNHTNNGEEIITELGCYGEKVLQMVGQHHEKYCGGGYHRGLKQEEISPFARICKISDVYDALTTRRSYKRALAPLEALLIMKQKMGEEFDPQFLSSFICFMGPQ